MWAKCGFALVVAGLSCLPAQAETDPSIHWQTTLDSAKRLAAQSNQLVLVHFWAPWCGMCRRMEQDVFPQPSVVAAIEANYVPVKLNTDYFPATARQYGIHALPTDIIINSQGQLLHKQEGMLEAAAYVDLLGHVAANFKPRPTPVLAQLSGDNSASNPNQNPANNNTGAGGNISGPQASAGPGAPGGYWLQHGNPPLAGTTAPNGPSSAAANPSVAAVGGPSWSPPTAVQTVPAMSPQPNSAQPGPTPANMAGPPFQWGQPGPATAPAATLSANPPAMALNQPGAMAAAGNPNQPPATNPAAASALPVQPGPGSTAFSPAAADNADRRSRFGLSGNGPSASIAASKPSQSSQTLPSGAPPLGLDGFCPVQLVETQRWLHGDPRWGVIHRGRTYLFTGSAEQRKFLADPDAYAPVMSGNDIVVRVEHNEQVAGHREHGVFCDGKIYLFVSEDSLQKFNRAPARYIAEVQQVLRPSSYQR
jgi:YHS domain-containing protein/thiol-disulfide isomerase/thioredoxin